MVNNNFFKEEKKMIDLTPRLRCITDFVNAEVAADIGCDHAYVAITLIDENRAKKVIACDIKEGPLDIARENIEKYNKSSCIETRIGSGLSPLLQSEADTIIIAGMGGELIENILREDIEKAKTARLILQPMNSQETLRKWLIENGFKIEKEDIATEGFKVYNIMSAAKGKMKPFKTEIEYHIPLYLKDNKNYKPLFEKKKREFEKVIKGLERSKEPDTEKLKKYKMLYNQLMNM